MQRFVRGSALCLLVLASACGGQIEREPGGGGSSGSGQSAAGGAGAGTSFPSKPLGECKPGFSRYQNPTLPCPWLGDGLCYEDKDAACACVCPKDHDSWCASDFPGPGGAPTQVTCD